ncbi:MAG: glycosyltransferase family 4 protein [Nitrospiraceae bacterium]|nr:glycosyltransferase family 4 protein [Nitrospiraceae bacterium]
MKILVVTNMYPRYMGGSFVHEQTRRLMGSGCEFKVIAPAAFYPGAIERNKWGSYSRIPASEIIDGVPVHHPRYFRLPGKWFHPLSCYTEYLGLKNAADAIIREFKPDIIHAHAATPAGFVGLLLKKKYGLPLICSLRGSDVNLYPGYGRLSLHMTRRVIAESDGLVSVCSALKDSANAIARAKSRIHVIYNGCDHDTFARRAEDRRSVREEFGIPEPAKVLVFVGSISGDKGIFELMASLRLINRGRAGIHLLIVGSGPEESALRSMAASSDLHANMHQTGDLPHKEIARVLSAADIFVLPSHHEGLPNAALEAMACALPVIATRAGGIPEAVEDGKSGILVRTRDAVSLANAIECLLMNDHLAAQMGNHGREIVKKKFTWQVNSEKIFDLYRELTDAK